MTRPLITVLLSLCSAALIGSVSAQVRLPDFGDPADSVFSSSLERAVGEAFMQEVRATMTLVNDPEVAGYIQSLGYSLASATSQQNVGFNFFVVEDGLVNAFAAPGGWVGVNTGLILASESESELAAVLAHEIAHISQRHIARQVALNERSSVSAIVGLLAAIAIGMASPEAGQAAAATVIGAQVQRQLDFSRANEQEADRVGMQMLYDAGHDPSAMAGFFEKLQSAGRYYRAPPEFLSTHPVTSSRIADAQGRARQFGVRHHRDSLAYQMVRAKLRLSREADDAKLIASFEKDIRHSAPARSPGPRYGLALAKARSGRAAEAGKELEALIKENPDNTELQIARAEVAVRAGERALAEAIYSDAHQLMPDNTLVTQSYVEAMLSVDNPKRALTVLERHQRLAGLTPQLYRLQADALARLGRTSDSQVALAEHHAGLGQLDAAINQLQLATRSVKDDFYKSSRIEARIEALEAERARRAKVP